MKDRYGWKIRVGYNSGEEKEPNTYADEDSAREAFGELDLESGGYDWAQLVKIDWYKRSESVVDEITK